MNTLLKMCKGPIVKGKGYLGAEIITVEKLVSW